MKINRAYKFRLYPSVLEQELINKTIGCSRFVYNKSLSLKNENNSLSKYDLYKEIPKLAYEYPFLKEVDSMALRSAVTDLDSAFKKFYSKNGGYPRFKKKGCKESYRTNLISSSYKGKIYANIKIDLEKRVIVLPKLGKIKIRGYRNMKVLNGRIINATIEHITNKYYVSVCVEEEIVLPKKQETRAVGIDLGVKALVVTSDGEEYGNPRYNEKYEKRVKKLQKDLARKERGSKNYIKTKKKIQEVYLKLKNARKKLGEEIVSKIVKYNDIIITEKLKVKEMIEKKKNSNNKNLRKSIINATFSEIIRRLEYKCRWLNKVFYQVGTYYASSQICSRCGNINKQLKDLRIREYKCPRCGIEIGRDKNASINIMYEGVCNYFKEQYN